MISYFTSALGDVQVILLDHYRSHLIDLSIRGIKQNLPFTLIAEEMENFRTDFVNLLNTEPFYKNSLTYEKSAFESDQTIKLKTVAFYFGQRTLLGFLEAMIRNEYPLNFSEEPISKKFPGFVFPEFERAAKPALKQVLQLPESKVKTAKSRRLDYPDEMNAEEAAEFLNTTIKNLYQLTSSRTVPHYKRGRKLMFKKAELQNWRLEKVSSNDEIKTEAANYSLKKVKRR